MFKGVFHYFHHPFWRKNHHILGFLSLGGAGGVAERLKERFGAFGATLGNERELEEPRDVTLL